MWYAIEFAYGGTVVNHGLKVDRLRRFRSKRDRNEWVHQGNENCMAPGYREALRARDRIVRSRNENDWLLIDADWRELKGPAE